VPFPFRASFFSVPYSALLLLLMSKGNGMNSFKQVEKRLISANDDFIGADVMCGIHFIHFSPISRGGRCSLLLILHMSELEMEASRFLLSRAPN